MQNNQPAAAQDPLREVLSEAAIRRVAASHYADQSRIAALAGCLADLIRSAARHSSLRPSSGDLIDPSYPPDTQTRVAGQKMAERVIRENRAALLAAAGLTEQDLATSFTKANSGQTRNADLVRRRGWLYCALDLAIGAGPTAIKGGLGDPRDRTTIINNVNKHREMLPTSRVALDDFLVVLRRVKAIIPTPIQ